LFIISSYIASNSTLKLYSLYKVKLMTGHFLVKFPNIKFHQTRCIRSELFHVFDVTLIGLLCNANVPKVVGDFMGSDTGVFCCCTVGDTERSES
jgi:hypothetical protein